MARLSYHTTSCDVRLIRHMPELQPEYDGQHRLEHGSHDTAHASWHIHLEGAHGHLSWSVELKGMTCAQVIATSTRDSGELL